MCSFELQKCSKNVPKFNLVSASLPDSFFGCPGGAPSSKTYVLLKENICFWKVTLSLPERFWAPKWIHFGSKNLSTVNQKSFQKLSRKYEQNLFPKRNPTDSKTVLKVFKIIPKAHRMTPTAPKNAQEPPMNALDTKMIPKAFQNDSKSFPEL